MGRASQPFHELLQERNRAVLDRASQHRFWLDLAAGRLTDEHLILWLGQEYAHARVVERFVVLIGSHAPESLRRQFTQTLLHLHQAIERFEEIASGVDLNLRETRVSLGTHAFNAFLLATAATGSFETASAAYYVNNLTFFHGWSGARGGQSGGILRQTFSTLFGEPVYQDWVGGLERAIDEVATMISAEDREKMISIVPISIEFQSHHWDGIYEELFA